MDTSESGKNIGAAVSLTWERRLLEPTSYERVLLP